MVLIWQKMFSRFEHYMTNKLLTNIEIKFTKAGFILSEKKPQTLPDSGFSVKMVLHY